MGSIERIKNCPTCPTILPHADKPRQYAICSQIFGRIIFQLSYLFSLGLFLPNQRMASEHHLWAWGFGRILSYLLSYQTHKWRQNAIYGFAFGRIIILPFYPTFYPTSKKSILPFLSYLFEEAIFSSCVGWWARKNRRSFLLRRQ